jgi:hypothetical protein
LNFYDGDKMNFKFLRPVSVVVLLLGVFLLGACSSDERVIYSIKKDEETGILYNVDWQDHLDAKSAYYNDTNGLVNVRSGPADTHKVSAYLKQDVGGFIEKCNFDLQYCYLDFGGKPESGWVNMTYMKAGTAAYKK